jgi:hypothetical protein
LKTEEYIAEVMPDGHLSLPETVTKELDLKPHAKVRVTIEKVDGEKEIQKLSPKARKKALVIKEFIVDMGPKDLSEKFREKYK